MTVIFSKKETIDLLKTSLKDGPVLFAGLFAEENDQFLREAREEIIHSMARQTLDAVRKKDHSLWFFLSHTDFMATHVFFYNVMSKSQRKNSQVDRNLASAFAWKDLVDEKIVLVKNVNGGAAVRLSSAGVEKIAGTFAPAKLKKTLSNFRASLDSPDSDEKVIAILDASIENNKRDNFGKVFGSSATAREQGTIVMRIAEKMREAFHETRSPLVALDNNKGRGGKLNVKDPGALYRSLMDINTVKNQKDGSHSLTVLAAASVFLSSTPQNSRAVLPSLVKAWNKLIEDKFIVIVDNDPAVSTCPQSVVITGAGIMKIGETFAPDALNKAAGRKSAPQPVGMQ